jgi:hypothetical protein
MIQTSDREVNVVLPIEEVYETTSSIYAGVAKLSWLILGCRIRRMR